MADDEETARHFYAGTYGNVGLLIDWLRRAEARFERVKHAEAFTVSLRETETTEAERRAVREHITRGAELGIDTHLIVGATSEGFSSEQRSSGAAVDEATREVPDGELPAFELPPIHQWRPGERRPRNIAV